MAARSFIAANRWQTFTTQPVLGKAIRHAAVDFRMAHNPAYRNLAVINGEGRNIVDITRFTSRP